MILERVVIDVDRPLMGLSMACPESTCRLHCHCMLFVPGELAIFECRACQRRYFVGLGAQPLLRSEAIE